MEGRDLFPQSISDAMKKTVTTPKKKEKFDLKTNFIAPEKWQSVADQLCSASASTNKNYKKKVSKLGESTKNAKGRRRSLTEKREGNVACDSIY